MLQENRQTNKNQNLNLKNKHVFIFINFPWTILADNIKKCHKGDNVCFSESVRDILQNFPNGLRSLNLINFDPLHVNSMEMKQNPNSAVNIDLKFKNIDVIGLKTAKVKQIK